MIQTKRKKEAFKMCFLYVIFEKKGKKALKWRIGK